MVGDISQAVWEDASGRTASAGAFSAYGPSPGWTVPRSRSGAEVQARYYDPSAAALGPMAVGSELGRFLSNDPVGFSPDKPFMFNRYAYVANDPVNNWDPNGEETKVAVKAYPIGSYPIGGQYGHSYVEYSDTDTGETRISRGGPSKGASASSAVSGSDSGGKVTAVDTPAGKSIDSGRDGTITVTETTVPETLGEVQAELEGFNSKVNGSDSPYNARGNNSNTYAGDAYEAVTGIEPKNETDLDLPAFDKDLRGVE